MLKTEQALANFDQAYNCAQAVFATFAPDLGLDRETALKIASGFGGGMGRSGQTCGAVSGALMVIGLSFGYTDNTDYETKAECYELVHRFITQFTELHGTVNCSQLLGCDIGTPEGRETAQQQDLFATLCPKLVQDAVRIVERLLV